MGQRPTKGHEDALWQIRLAGENACPTLAPVGQALPPANRRLQRSRCLLGSGYARRPLPGSGGAVRSYKDIPFAAPKA